MEPEQAFGELGLNRHNIRFNSCVQLRLSGSMGKCMESGLLRLESVTIKLEGTDIEDRKSMFISWALQVID
jgi:integrator complex subunit 11